jgi:hypothetical protein
VFVHSVCFLFSLPSHRAGFFYDVNVRLRNLQVFLKMTDKKLSLCLEGKKNIGLVFTKIKNTQRNVKTKHPSFSYNICVHIL